MTHTDELTLARVPTGIAGLDTILRGGLLQGGVYIVEGAPGAGKTILANHICYNHVAARGRAVFVTLLAESHSRMLQHLRAMSFFDESVIPDRLYYVSGFNVLESDGLKGTVELIRREIKGHDASLLVLDGFAHTEESAASPREFKKFIHELQSHAATAGCTVLLLTNGTDRRMAPEYTMVDGVIELDDELFKFRRERSLQVRKFRGSGFLRGRHPFRITEHGIELFPRIEVAYATPTVRDVYRVRRMRTGIPGFDEVINGGLPAETTNGLLGPTGVGKTTFGLQFLAASSAEEPGLFFGTYENPERLRVRAATMGIDLRALEQQGHVEVIWRPQGEHILDELGHLIIENVRRRGAKRVFIDGYGGFSQSAVHPERITRFIAVFGNQLRAMNATTVLSMESRDVLGASMELPSEGMSSLLEGLIVMRYAELQGEMRRFVTITKIRDSAFDPFLRDFKITARGVEIGGTYQGVEALLSGMGRAPRAVPAPDRDSRGASRE